MKYLVIITLSFLLLNCKSDASETVTAQSLIDKAIQVSGGDLMDSTTIHFDFRDKHYMAFRNKGVFHLERQFKALIFEEVDSINEVKDVLNNKGFMRFVDNSPMNVTDTMAAKYAASVNSVHYFSVLPYGLNDAAVNKKRLADMMIKDHEYFTIQVTFNQDGGGEDFEDVFIYWINKASYKVDYLAYSYNESDGLGLRFREVYNERYIKGIRFVDYNNYKPNDASISLIKLPELFNNNQLKLLSKIELEEVTVN
ncbi:DUF6503 family protein [uncultured Psychroserpens sp.]|uniref:DUF6503 family protein n=1 Tax=uncultured Psychroserpens sp. TaxID=255436 RepID=UPI00260DD68D|nr:DUF6503 family protein [uncultured Psychroserpens sp.]